MSMTRFGARHYVPLNRVSVPRAAPTFDSDDVMNVVEEPNSGDGDPGMGDVPFRLDTSPYM